MKNDLHPLDRRFGRALRQHEQTPRPEAWKRLEARMGREETRRFVPFWAYGVAASVALLLLAGIWWVRQPDDSGENQPQLAATQKPAVEKPAPQPVKPEPTVSEKASAPVLPADAPHVAQHTTPKSAASAPKTETPRKFRQPEVVPVVKPELNVEASMQVAKAEQAQPSQPTEAPKPALAQITPPAPAVEPAKAAPTTLVVTLANTDFDEKPATDQPRKRNRLGRLLRQLDNAKHGDRVDWNEVGINPPGLLARAEEKIERSTDKVNETYRTLKDKSAF